MNLKRYFPCFLVFLGFATCVMTCGSVSAQGGGKSLPELSTQVQKIKVWETTETEVISLLGQPSKVSEENPSIAPVNFWSLRNYFTALRIILSSL